MTLSILALPVLSVAQSKESMNYGNEGDPVSMYERGLSLMKRGGGTKDVKEAFSWFQKSAESDFGPAQAMVAYYFKNGISVNQDRNKAWTWAVKGSEKNDGFAFWLLAQMAKENSGSLSEIRSYIESALGQNYPLAQLLYSKYYATGSSDFGISQNKAVSEKLLQEAADQGLTDAAALLGGIFAKQGKDYGAAFRYLKAAADGNNPHAMSQVANMLYYGLGTGTNDSQTFKYYEKAGAANDPAGVEGLADCYRLGIGAGVFQERAFNLYSKLSEPSSRILYILGHYYNDGVCTAIDRKKAISLFEKSASMGSIFALAMLGTAYYEGTAPFDARDFSKAYPLLKAAFDSEYFNQLPPSVAADVLSCLAKCFRFGRGGAVKNIAEAERLQKMAEEKRDDSTAPLPFAVVGMIPFGESIAAYNVSWDSDEFSDILGKATFDYPKDNLNRPSSEEIAKVSKTDNQVSQQGKEKVKSDSPTASAGRSGRVVFILDAAPYGFGPTSVVSSRDRNTYWLRGQVMEFSASAGWLSGSGAFIGGGAAYDIYSGSRMSVVRGFIEAIYFIGAPNNSGILLGVQAGIASGSPDFGMGMSASGKLGYRIHLSGNSSIIFGAKADVNSFSDDNKTKGTLVAPYVGISF